MHAVQEPRANDTSNEAVLHTRSGTLVKPGKQRGATWVLTTRIQCEAQSNRGVNIAWPVGASA